jgi:hypothetical protein
MKKENQDESSDEGGMFMPERKHASFFHYIKSYLQGYFIAIRKMFSDVENFSGRCCYL